MWSHLQLQPNIAMFSNFMKIPAIMCVLGWDKFTALAIMFVLWWDNFTAQSHAGSPLQFWSLHCGHCFIFFFNFFSHWAGMSCSSRSRQLHTIQILEYSTENNASKKECKPGIQIPTLDHILVRNNATMFFQRFTAAPISICFWNIPKNNLTS